MEGNRGAGTDATDKRMLCADNRRGFANAGERRRRPNHIVEQLAHDPPAPVDLHQLEVVAEVVALVRTLSVLSGNARMTCSVDRRERPGRVAG
jgi:hypothetical protein